MATPASDLQNPPVRPLRCTLLEKINRSRCAWDHSVTRFRALHWICLTGVIILPTCLAGLKDYLPAFAAAVISVVVAIFGSVQAIVKPFDKYSRDIEFRDEADFFFRQVEATDDPSAISKFMDEFEPVERRFHQGLHPWPVLKRGAKGKLDDDPII